MPRNQSQLHEGVQRKHDIAVVRLVAMSGLLCLTACGPARFHYRLHEHSVAAPIIFTAARTELVLFVTTPGEEARDTSNPSTIVCHITAPSGASVECAVTPWVRPSLDEDNGTSKLSFTPSETGWHQVRATVPEGGEFVWRLYSMSRREEVAERVARSCSWLERFPDGAWLCDGVFVRDGEPAQALNAELTAVADDVVWTLSSGRLARLREPLPQELIVAPSQNVETGLSDVTALLAGPDDVLLVHPGGVVRVGPDGNGALVRSAALERSIAEQSVVLRVGSELLVGSTLVPFVIGTDPANQTSQQSEVCRFSVGSAAITLTDCQRYAGNVRGAIDDAVLLADSGNLRVVGRELDAGLELQLPAPLAAAVPFTARGLVMLPGNVIPRVSGGVLLLESWPGATAASGRLVWSAGMISTSVRARE